MKFQPTNYFYELLEQIRDWKLCVEVIKHYIQFLDVPEGLFENEESISIIDRFQYFTNVLNSNFDVKFRRYNCHEELFETLQKYGIQDEEILWWYIWEFLGYKIPRISVCELHNPDHDKFDYPHCAPFDYIKDMFFETVKDTIAFANRTGGKTSNVAVLNHLDMTFKNGCEVASAGATLDQAAKVYRYFTMFHKHPVLQSLLFKPPTKSMTIYKNDSLQEVVTGSIKGLNSPHPQKARIDEVELIEWDVLQEGFSMSMSKGKIQGQITMLCVTGDTLIDISRDKRKFPKGIPIKDLVGKSNLWGYTFSFEKRKFTLSKINKVWQTKRDIVWKLKYSWEENGQEFQDEIKATKDHLIMLRDGRYRELQDLKPDDSLMPFNRRLIGNYYQVVKITGTSELVVKRALEQSGVSLRNKSEASKLMWNFVDKDKFRETKRIECYERWGNFEKAKELRKVVNHKVVSVECMNYEDDMYDLEVEGSHNFVAQGLVLHNSTRKYDTGSFNRLLEESESRGIKVFCWCIFEVLEKCTRKCEADEKYGDCPIWDKCKGIAHHCNGFYQLDDWIGKARLLSKETLDTQWFNKKPSRDILVYGDSWQEEIHYREMDELEISPDCMIMSAIDFGSSPGHDFVYQKAWVDYSDLFRAMEELEPGKELFYKLKFFVFYEYRTSKGTLAYHAAKIKGSPDYREGEIIFADPSAKQSRIDLQETYKIDTYMAVNEVVDGIDNVRHHLEVYRDYRDGGKEKSNYYIIKGYLDKIEEQGKDSESKIYRLLGTHEEFDRYKYPKQQDGKVVRKIPVPINDHGLDCTRYIIHTSYKIIMDLVVPVEDDITGGYWGNAREEQL